MIERAGDDRFGGGSPPEPGSPRECGRCCGSRLHDVAAMARCNRFDHTWSIDDRGCGGRRKDVSASRYRHLGRHHTWYSCCAGAQSIRTMAERRSGSRARGGTAFALVLLRWCYTWLRGREGLGFGDVKLAAAVGAWLPLASIPFCFALATCSALVTIMLARLRGESIDATAKLPFGAFLCPALWLVFYALALPG